MTPTKPRPAPSTPNPRRRGAKPAAAPAEPTKPVRLTLDLDQAAYTQLRAWTTTNRVAGTDVLRAAIAHLAANPAALNDVVARAKEAKNERDRRRLGK